VGAPYEAVFVGGQGRDCQYFEGGTFCDNGQTGYTYSPRFTDVPLDFWGNRYIGWVITEEIAGGYNCGGAGEPCDDASRPYFRPNANMTRSQFAKVVSNMLIINDDPGGQIYEDVPVGSPFFVWINRLTSRGIMGGYPCGGPGEPCVPPLNRPYFRPGADITKGQAAKIVANSVTQPDIRWLYIYGTNDGPDFYDTPSGSEFYSYVELLYRAGVVQYRLEDPEAPGQGGKFYPYRAATRAEISMLLHELVYAAAPTP
jgi:hypothetical protein